MAWVSCARMACADWLINRVIDRYRSNSLTLIIFFLASKNQLNNQPATKFILDENNSDEHGLGEFYYPDEVDNFRR